MRSLVAIVIQLGIVGLVAFGVWWALRMGKERAPEGGPAPVETPGDGTTVGRSATNGTRSAIGKNPRVSTEWRKSIENLLDGKVSQTGTETTVDRYLNDHRRSADSLIAASFLRQDLDYLKEAAQQYPDDPRVQLAVLAHQDDPAQRQAWIERFKESDPNNPLPSYLAARDHLATGDVSSAIAELEEASDKDQFQDYAIDYWQGIEEFHTNRGESSSMAKALAFTSTPLPHTKQIKELGQELAKVHEALVANGDTAGAETVAVLAINLGNRLSQGDGSTLMISESLGMAIEGAFLNRLDPNKDYPYFSGSIEDMKAAVQAQQSQYKGAVLSRDLLFQLSEDQVVSYFDRVKLFGERKAGEWLLEQTQ